MNTTTLGIDLAKNISQLHGVDKNGCVTFRKTLSRSKFPVFTAQLPPCLIGIEACGGSHYWARKLKEQGHEVKIMAAKFIKPYIKSNKNDRNDAEAICEAVQRPSMRFVPQKTVYQQSFMLDSIKRQIDVMLLSRDKKMARNMLPYFEKGDAFAVVGFGHLSGVLEELKAQGYEVRSVELSVPLIAVEHFEEEEESSKSDSSSIEEQE